ncbi:MAG TPA: C4-type zinc ribbon domain-containing protein [Candidatus Paceibacterota bacterium]|nr:C4-type zinc ribbon domain-containing protein [Candidatus Paceibacterota bacterium]
MSKLLKLQGLEFDRTPSKDEEKEIAELRTQVPEPILGHYSRLIARGKKGVAIIRNQVCTGCQMRLPIGTITTLMRNEDIQLCDSCGRYLYLPETPEETNPTAEAKPVKKSKSRKPKASKSAESAAQA